MMQWREKFVRHVLAGCCCLNLFLCFVQPVIAGDETLADQAGNDLVEVQGKEQESGFTALDAAEQEAITEADAVEAKDTEAADERYLDSVSKDDGNMAEKADGEGAGPEAASSGHVHFNMDALIERLKNSDAIGVFTKLALRSDAMDVVEEVKSWREHRGHITLHEIRARFDGLLLKVLALLDDDPALSADISMARDDIWNSLLEGKA